jgi:hypothetical protein
VWESQMLENYYVKTYVKDYLRVSMDDLILQQQVAKKYKVGMFYQKVENSWRENLSQKDFVL